MQRKLSPLGTTLLAEEAKNSSGNGTHENGRQHGHEHGIPSEGGGEVPPTEIGKMGRIALYAGMFGMVIPMTYFFLLIWQVRNKFFHAVSCYICGFAALAYMYMVGGNGMVVVDGRPFFWVRYADWMITTPLLLMDLLGLCGADKDMMFALIGADMLMIASGLLGVFMDGAQKWIFWAFGMLMFMPIVYFLSTGLMKSAEEVGTSAAASFRKTAILTVATWSCYPLVWVIGEGTHSVSPGAEVMLYAILDVIAKSVFGYMIVSDHDALDEVFAARRVRAEAAALTGPTSAFS